MFIVIIFAVVVIGLLFRKRGDGMLDSMSTGCRGTIGLSLVLILIIAGLFYYFSRNSEYRNYQLDDYENEIDQNYNGELTEDYADEEDIPDSDNDGVSDNNDECPNIPGKGEDGCQIDGDHVFWFDADYNGKWEDDIKIYVDNEYVGTLNEWFNTNPGCYTSGCVTISKPPGHYRWEAKSSGGFYWSGGDFEILEGECGDQRMWVN